MISSSLSTRAIHSVKQYTCKVWKLVTVSVRVPQYFMYLLKKFCFNALTTLFLFIIQHLRTRNSRLHDQKSFAFLSRILKAIRMRLRMWLFKSSSPFEIAINIFFFHKLVPFTYESNPVPFPTKKRFLRQPSSCSSVSLCSVLMFPSLPLWTTTLPLLSPLMATVALFISSKRWIGRSRATSWPDSFRAVLSNAFTIFKNLALNT
jgi:hypothetical protein